MERGTLNSMGIPSLRLLITYQRMNKKNRLKYTVTFTERVKINRLKQ